MNKNLKKIILFLSLGAGFLILLNLFYNKNTTLAQSEEKTKSRLLCGKEIPSGEAMDKTAELLNGLIKEIEIMNANVFQQIRAADSLVNFAGQCDTGQCQPVCQQVCVENEEGKEECSCNAGPCTSPWGGRACPQSQIEDSSQEIIDTYKKIENSKKEIFALINGADDKTDRRESLCEALNEDIVAPGEIVILPTDETLSAGTVSCPKITKKEVISRKLYKARSEFDKCYVPPSDWEKIARGEKSGKVLMSCSMVMTQDLPRETKTKERGIYVCTSLNNYFCCY